LNLGGTLKGGSSVSDRLPALGDPTATGFARSNGAGAIVGKKIPN